MYFNNFKIKSTLYNFMPIFLIGFILLSGFMASNHMIAGSGCLFDGFTSGNCANLSGVASAIEHIGLFLQLTRAQLNSALNLLTPQLSLFYFYTPIYILLISVLLFFNLAFVFFQKQYYLSSLRARIFQKYFRWLSIIYSKKYSLV